MDARSGLVDGFGENGTERGLSKGANVVALRGVGEVAHIVTLFAQIVGYACHGERAAPKSMKQYNGIGGVRGVDCAEQAGNERKYASAYQGTDFNALRTMPGVS